MHHDLPSTFAQAARRSAARAPRQIAIRLDRSSSAYDDLIIKAERWARRLSALGLCRGDRFGILLPNCFETIELLLAASMSGLVAVPINIRFKGFEVQHLISHSKMKLLITLDAIEGVVDFAQVIQAALPSLSSDADPRRLAPTEAPELLSIVLLRGEQSTLGGACLFADHLPEQSAGDLAGNTAADPLVLLYTSGTTARPKGCVISERALQSNIAAIIDRLTLTPDDSWWCPLPMFHVGGILFPMLMLSVGGTYLATTHFDADTAIDAITDHRPTILYPLFPPISLPLIESPRFADLPLDQVRFVVNVAPPDLQKRIQRAFGDTPLLSAFGMTEAAGVVTYHAPNDPAEQRLTNCGKPLSGWQIRIVDPDTHEALDNETRGEIALAGPGLFDRYLDDPEATARQFLADGYFLTGDAGLLDAHGELHFLGRLKDQLKVGGENVSALEVESFLTTHPAIKMAQVVGVVDDHYGEVVAAFIELFEAQSLTADEVTQFCTGQIARFKIPRHVRFVDQWPMSATKIQKFRLKDDLEAELTRAHAHSTQ